MVISSPLTSVGTLITEEVAPAVGVTLCTGSPLSETAALAAKERTGSEIFSLAAGLAASSAAIGVGAVEGSENEEAAAASVEGDSGVSAASTAFESDIFSTFGVAGVGSITVTLGRAPLPSHSALLSITPKLFAAGVTFRAYSLASMPLGNCTRKHSMPIAISSSACLCAAVSPASSRS